MEVAALTAAHSHARKAIEEYQLLHLTAATDEYQSAALDFAKARKGTSDSEALRVLRLLEEQHQRLARIFKSQNAGTKNLPPDHSATKERAPSTPKEPGSPPPNEKRPEVSFPSRAKPTTTALAQAKLSQRSRDRDTSPALAKDIANRRGIPSSGHTRHPAVRQLSPGTQHRRSQPETPKIPPSIVDSQASLALIAARAKRAESDEGFTKFYSDITSGAMSKLSSVLAFSGLPLAQQEQALETSPIERRRGKDKYGERTVRANNDPDVKKIFSSAALSAIEASRHFGPAESFYVVQPTGGTSSFADITKSNQQHSQHLLDIGEAADEDAFVDAREVSGATSPPTSRRFGKARTGEELELENATLKQTLEHMANRLAEFEKHAQDASMAALTQSMISTRGADTRGNGSGGHEALLTEKVHRMEEQMAHEREERQRLESKVAKYRGKLEVIKAGVKEKERLRSDVKTSTSEKAAEAAVGQDASAA